MSTLTCSVCRSFSTAAACASAETGAAAHGVDHGGQVPKGQGIQRPEILLSDIAKECGDLGIVHNTGKGNSLSSRKYQGMEPHGHHDPHSAERADDGAGVSGVIQKVVGDIQPGRSQPTRARGPDASPRR